MEALTLVFLSVTATFNLPAGLLSALCFVESGHHVQAINLSDHGSPSLGLCQVKLATARGLGFRGPEKELTTNARINAHYAGAYMRYQLNRYHGNTTMAIGAYNSGTFRVNNKGTAVNSRYIVRVYEAWHFQR